MTTVQSTLMALLLCCFIPTLVMGQDTDYALLAKKSNMELKLLMAKLPVCHDTIFYYNLVYDIVKTAVECDSFDSKPNAKGKVRQRYRNANAHIVGNLHHKLLDGGLYYDHRHDNENALKLLDLYINTRNHPLFDKQKTNVGLAALTAGKAAYSIKDYRKAEEYADVALADNQYARDAAQLKVYCMKMLMTTDAEAQNYIAALLTLHGKDKRNPNYTELIIQYYSDKGMKEELAGFVNKELLVKPEDKMLWALKGEINMGAREWDEAIRAFEKAVACDSLFLPAIYNIGICYASKAIQITDSLEIKNGNITEAQAKDIKKILLCGRRYLEKSQQLDPLRHTVDWAPPLYQIYYALGDERAEKVKQLIKY